MMYNEIDIEDVKSVVESALASGKNCSITIVRMGEDVSLIFHDSVTPTDLRQKMSAN